MSVDRLVSRHSYIYIDKIIIPITDCRVASNEGGLISAEIKGRYSESATPEATAQSLMSGQAVAKVSLSHNAGPICFDGEFRITDFDPTPTTNGCMNYSCRIESVGKQEPSE